MAGQLEDYSNLAWITLLAITPVYFGTFQGHQNSRGKRNGSPSFLKRCWRRSARSAERIIKEVTHEVEFAALSGERKKSGADC